MSNYPPGRHTETDEATLFDTIDALVQGTLIVAGEGSLHFSYAPFLLDRERRVLLGHIAKVNPQHEFMHGKTVDIIFHGPHAYISPSLFGNTEVPTWNYANVEVRGEAKVFHDAETKRALIYRLAERMEGNNVDAYFEKDAERIGRLLNAIVGIEISVDKITGRFKLSRNDKLPKQQLAFTELEKATPPNLAEWLETLRPAE